MKEKNLIKESRGPACCSVIGLKVLHYSELASTNRTAMEMAQEGASEGLVIVANRQTEGRGRLGRSWFSPQDKGLYFSIILKPRCRADNLSLLPLVAGVGVARGLEKFSIRNVRIKWPNDVEIAGRKVAGILVESRQINGDMYAILGIGVNVSNKDFPDELSERATSIELATGMYQTNEEILGFLLDEIERFYSNVCLGKNKELISEIRRLDSLKGKRVTITAGDKIEGIASGIDETGALLVKTDDGEQFKINSGEVKLVRTSDS